MFSKILNYKMQEYKILGVLSNKEIVSIQNKYKIRLSFKLRRFLKEIILFVANFFLKKKKILIKSRELAVVKKKYDKIAGSYIDIYNQRSQKEYLCDLGKKNEVYRITGDPKIYYNKFLTSIINHTNSKSVMEIGAGELTNILDLKKNKACFKKIFALDISYKRLIKGRKFLGKHKIKIDNLIKADASNIPLNNNSIDLLFTSHCLEQVPHLAKKIIKEMIRVAKNYIVFIEPSYEFGSKITKNRIYKKNYIKINNKTFNFIDAKIIYRKLNPLSSYLNSSEIIILKKIKKKYAEKEKINYICPNCKKILIFKNKDLFCSTDNRIYKLKKGILYIDEK